MAARRTFSILFTGIALALACGAAGGHGQPAFETVAARHRPDPWHSDPCGPTRPMAGICRMLRPVKA
jgi:hypothetical protein